MADDDFLSLAWWQRKIDPRVTSAEVRSRSHGVAIHIYWHGFFTGGFHCHASLSGEGASFEDALKNARASHTGGVPIGPETTLQQRFQESVDWYGRHAYVKFEFDPAEIEEIAALEQSRRDRQDRELERFNIDTRAVEDRIFQALALRGYNFRFKSCAPIHGEHRDNKNRIIAVEVIDADQGEALEREWGMNRERRALEGRG